MKYVKIFEIDYDINRKVEDLFDLTINYKFAEKAMIEWLMEILNEKRETVKSQITGIMFYLVVFG